VRDSGRGRLTGNKVIGPFDYSDLPRTLGAWMAVRHAELMLEHLSAAPTHWRENAIYCHSCFTAMRSVTLLLQKALKHAEGFSEWYEGVQARLAADPEFEYLKEARNYVLHEGALEIVGSYRGGEVDLRPKAVAGLPDPPTRDLKEALADKIKILERLVDEADTEFVWRLEEGWDPEIDGLLDAE
jgi:hypothetical protein